MSSSTVRIVQEESAGIGRTFAGRMRYLRETEGISQTTLASRLELRGIKLDGTAITRMERGTRKIELTEAVAIAAALDVTLVEMLNPSLTPSEQVKQAEEHAERAEWNSMLADAERAAARARLLRLIERTGGDDGGEHQAAP